MNSLSTNFPSLLRSRRRAAGLSLEALAAATDKSLSCIRNWERGTTTPPLADLQRLAAVLGCSWTIDQEGASYEVRT